MADADGDGDGVAADDSLMRIDEGGEGYVAAKGREGVDPAEGVVVTVDVGRCEVGEGREGEGVGEVAGDGEGRLEGDGVQLVGRQEARYGVHTRKVRAVVGVAHLQLADGVGAIVLDDDFRIEGLAVLGLHGLGDGHDAGIDAVAAADYAEVVDGAAAAEVGVAVLLRCGVHEAELEAFVEVAAEDAGADVAAIPCVVAGEALVFGVVVPRQQRVVVEEFPLLAVAVVFDVHLAAVGEVVSDVEEQRVGTYLRYVDDRAVEVAHVADGT